MLKRLKVVETPLSNAFRHIEPTWRNYIYYVSRAAVAGDEDMAKVIASYEALPTRERTTIMPEKLCDLAGVDAGDMIAAVSREVWRHKQPESVITASMKHPKVIEATANFAIGDPMGGRDRELFFRLTGGLPDKKGASIVINNNPQTAINSQPSSGGLNGYKSMDQRVIDLGKLLDDPNELVAVPMSTKDSDLVLDEIDESED
jgi:hypothetical protein